jgi:DNA-binding winged helix-turn-helix (wHTH) protein
MTGNGSDRARFGPFEVDLHTHELWKFGTRLKLVGQPFEILAVLLRQPGELVTREELRNRLWPSDRFVDFNHGLNAGVNKLREALCDSAEDPRYVETLPRRGYRFIATIEWLDVRPAAPAASAPSDLPVLTTQTQTVSSQSARRRIWPVYFVAAGVLLPLVLVGAFLLRTASRNGETPAQSFGERKTRPLTNVIGAVEPAFSPDGNSVAFVREDVPAGQAGIFVTCIGSYQLLQLIHNDDDCCPVWSPDGRWIAFSRRANKQYSIYVVAADGGVQQKRTSEKKLNTRSAAYTLAAGSSERKLDTDGVVPRHGNLDWSPDGKSIAFAGETGIYLLFPDNSSVRRLTEQPSSSEDWGPAFSPDGNKVLFVRNRQIGLPDEIWVASVTGGDASRILSERGRIVSAHTGPLTGGPSSTPRIAAATRRSGEPRWMPRILPSRSAKPD